MATTAGILSQVSVGSTTAKLASAVATGGAAPYTYQWYRSVVSGFVPGGGNIITGATALTLDDSGLIPNTPYFYKVVATDSGAVADESAELAVTTAAPSISQNSFAQSPTVGMIDMRFPYNTMAVMVDVSQATALYPGSAVKMVDSAGGLPKVVGCAADSDDCLGFINFDIKTRQFVAGMPCEISMSGNVMYLYATNAIARGAQVQLELSSPGAVAAKVGASGADIVGWALDKAAGAGVLIRVVLKTPGFLKA